MKLTIVSDNTLGVPLRTLCDIINTRCSALECSVSDYRLAFDRPELIGDRELESLRRSDRLSDPKSFTVYITCVPFENNYFWHGENNRHILSLAGWNHYTDLPMANGILYFICVMILKYNLNVGVNHNESTGCLNDFMWDKSIVNTGMRAAFYCAECQKKTPKKTLDDPLYQDLIGLLDFISVMSRRGEDILNHPERPVSADSRGSVYDAFLCHNSEDKADVRLLNAALVSAGIKTWLDEIELRPGEVWHEKLEAQIESISGCLVIVGSQGQGPWQRMEYMAFINEFANRGCKIIPVIIGNSTTTPTLPLFLRQFMWVDLRNDNGTQLARLIGALRSG